MTIDLIWKGALALIGCFAAAYVARELLTDGVLGWVAGAAILAGTCSPLIKALIERRKSR